MEIILPKKDELASLLSGLATSKFVKYYSNRCGGWNLTLNGFVDTLLYAVMCTYQMGEPAEQVAQLDSVIPGIIDKLVSDLEIRSEVKAIYSAWIKDAEQFIAKHQ